MEEILKEVVIREAHPGSGYDTVFVVKNLPKKYLYEMAYPEVQRRDRDGNIIDGSTVPDFKSPKIEVLKRGISFNEDRNEYMFWTEQRDGLDAIAAVDQYIEATLPRDLVRPRRILYTSQRGNLSASPITKSQMPVVDLPLIQLNFSPVSAPVSPPTQVVQETPGNFKKERKPWTEEQKQAARERMAKAREMKLARLKA